MGNPGFNNPFYGRPACPETSAANRTAFATPSFVLAVLPLNRPNNVVEEYRNLSLSPDEPTLA